MSPIVGEGENSFESVCRRYGYRLPADFWRFLRLADEIHPENPYEAYDPIAFTNLDRTPLNPEYEEEEWECRGFPGEYCLIGSTGSGGHYGFVVDDPACPDEEYPVAEYFSEGGLTLVGNSFRECLSILVGQSEEWLENEEARDPKNPYVRRMGLLVKRLKKEFDLSPPDYIEAELDGIHDDRHRGDVVPTIDGLGCSLPPEVVDREYLANVKWPFLTPAVEGETVEALLQEAKSRLEAGQAGTALVIARNLRDIAMSVEQVFGDAEVEEIERVLVRAYEVLGRPHAGKNIRIRSLRKRNPEH